MFYIKITKVDYSKLSKTYDKYRKLPERDIDFTLSHIIPSLKDEALILDIGCGTGRYTIPLVSKYNVRVVGLDSSFSMLKEALKKDKRRIEWVCGDGELLPFKSNVFDCVLMMLVYHHFENKSFALKEAYRTLKLDGKLGIQTFSHKELRRRYKEYFCSVFPMMLQTDLKRFPSINRLKKQLTDTGFKNVHTRRVVIEHTISTSEFLERVKNRYISSLRLISNGEFREGIENLKRKLRYTQKIREILKFTIVIGEKR